MVVSGAWLRRRQGLGSGLKERNVWRAWGKASVNRAADRRNSDDQRRRKVGCMTMVSRRDRMIADLAQASGLGEGRVMAGARARLIARSGVGAAMGAAAGRTVARAAWDAAPVICRVGGCESLTVWPQML